MKIYLLMSEFVNRDTSVQDSIIRKAYVDKELAESIAHSNNKGFKGVGIFYYVVGVECEK